MTVNVEKLLRHSKQLFQDKGPVMSLWQEIALAFYPERADFTEDRNIGSEYGDHLLDSYPVIARRDLANMIGSMLREGEWFELVTDNELDHAGKSWLDWATKRQMKLMKMRGTGLTRSCKEADHDFVAFGQAVVSVEFSVKHDALLYRTWHLRDCAWSEDDRGEVGTVHRKWRPTLQEAFDIFGEDNFPHEYKEMYNENPMQKVDLLHVCMPTGEYGTDGDFPYYSVWVCCDHKHVITEGSIPYKHYFVPRFATIAGSQYAYSPATMAALPDSRLLQAMAHTLLEAGELAVRPPMLATQNAVRSDLNLYAGGVTWVDEKYDERLGEVLRPLGLDKSGLPVGFQMHDGTKQNIHEAFYLSKLTLPNTANMTAYEVNERMLEFRRQAKPLFSPIEEEYNANLCEATFERLMANNKFGSMQDLPRSLQGTTIDFKFSSPVAESTEKAKGQLFIQAAELVAAAAQIEPGVRHNFNAGQGLRDSIEGIGADQDWLREEEDVMALVQQEQQMAQLAQMAEGAGE